VVGLGQLQTLGVCVASDLLGPSYQGTVGQKWSLGWALPFLPQAGNGEAPPLGLFFYQVLLGVCLV
jgi:hypothetical protein